MILVISKTIATMKNIFKSLMLVAVAAMGFACQETMEENYTPTNPREVVMTIIADMDEETRTYISDEANGKIAWSAGDQLKVIENSNMYAETSNTEIVDGKAKFAVSFPANTTASEFTYNAVFPVTALVEDDAEKIDAAKVKVIVKDQQKPTATSFDPQADVLVAKQLEFDAQPTELNMQFKRLVALGKISLTNLPADEKISQVVFTAGANDILAGRNYVNATNGDVIEYGYYGKTNIIALNYDEAISTRDIYFTCNPFDMAAGDTFKVKVVCEDYTYTREVTIPEGRSLVFTEGDMTTFTVNMKDATIESSFVFADGVYAVIAKNNTSYYALSCEANGTRLNSVDNVDFDGGEVFATNNDNLRWTITYTEEGYIFKGFNNQYIAWTNGGNGASTQEAPYYLNIEKDEENDNRYVISSKEDNTRKLQRNKDIDQYKYWAFYTSEQLGSVYIVPVVADTTPRFTVDPMVFEFDAAGGEIIFTTTPNEYLKTTISATDDADWLTISGSGNTFTATATENKEASERLAEITFSAEGAESVVVTVTQKAAEVAGVTYLIEEEFDNTTTADSSSEISTSKFPNFNGERSKAYTSKYGGLKLGTSSAVGYITSKALDLSKPFIVEIDACKYGSDTGNIKITVGSVDKSIANTDLGAAGTFKTFTLEFDAATTNSTIKIATSAKRAYIDNVKVYYKDSGESGGDESETPAVPEKLATPVVTPSATSNSITVSWTDVPGAQSYAVSLDGGAATTVTGTTHTFTGLKANTKYEVSVVAVGDNYTNSDAATISVTTLAEQTGGGETPSEPVTITLDCSKQPFTTNLPTSKGTYKEATYTDKAGYEWTLCGTSATGYYFNSTGYLMIGKSGSYIGLPVVDGQKLTSVSLYCNSGASTNVKYEICDTSGNELSGGADKNGVSNKTTALTWDLSGTTESTQYRIRITSAYNGQITKIVLNYN